MIMDNLLMHLLQLLDGVVILSAVILNPRAKKRRKREVANPEDTEVGRNTGGSDPAIAESQRVIGEDKQTIEMSSVKKN